MTLGKNIRKYRKEAGLTQIELAKRMRVIQPNIARWETDGITPSIETLKKLSKILDVSVDSLLFTEKEKKKLKVGDRELIEKLNEIDQLSPEDRTMIVNMIDTLKLKSRMNGGSTQGSRNSKRPC